MTRRSAAAARWASPRSAVGCWSRLPFVLSSYHMFQLTMVVVYAIVLLGLNMLIGYNGQISLGHGAFFAIGAYTTAILIDKAAMPYWATIPFAGAVCLVAGFLFGLPALRLEGLYLALPTFALAVATPQLLKYKRARAAGPAASRASTSPSPIRRRICRSTATSGSISSASSSPCRCSSSAGTCCARAPAARMVAIRDHPMAAAAMGIDTAFYKTATFGVSAMYTGIAGALGALVTQFVAPDSFPDLPEPELPGRHRRRRHRLDSGRGVRRGVHRIRAQCRRRDLGRRALGDLRRIPDRLHVRDAARASPA